MKLLRTIIIPVFIASILLLPGCMSNLLQRVKNIFSKSQSSENKGLVTANNKVIATIDDFNKIFNLLSKLDSGLAFLSFLPAEEQKKMYEKIISDYLVSAYLIEEYLKEQGLDKAKDFQDDYVQFMKLSASNFYASELQKHISKNIQVSVNELKSYYQENQTLIPEFLNPPFVKEIPGIEARAVRIDDGKEAKDYEMQLKQNKDVIPLDRINRSMRGISARLIDALEVMADGQISEVTLENGMKFALYRIKSVKGEWENFDAVADQVKEIYVTKMLQKEYSNIIAIAKQKKDVVVDGNAIQMIMDSRMQKKIDKASLTEAFSKAQEELANAGISEEDLKNIAEISNPEQIIDDASNSSLK